MRNSWMVVACFVVGFSALSSAADSVHRNREKNGSRLKRLADRYAVQTEVKAIKAKLPLTFGYQFTDDYGTVQAREEKTYPNGSKTGFYSFVDAIGIYRHVEYVADHRGFRAIVATNEPGTKASDPAHVRMIVETKNFGNRSFSHTIRNVSHVEYSSTIFSRYSFSGNYRHSKSNYPIPVQNSVPKTQKSITSQTPLFKSDREKLENQKNSKNVNSYEEVPQTSSSEIPPLLQELEDSQLEILKTRQNSEKFLGDPNVNDLIFNDKTSSVGYPKKVTTRQPCRRRDSRASTKKKKELKIHIPKGYDDHHDLLLYKDK